jgi:hypothetical protein
VTMKAWCAMLAQWHAAFVEGMKAQGKWVERVRPKGKTVRAAPRLLWRPLFSVPWLWIRVSR